MRFWIALLGFSILGGFTTAQPIKLSDIQTFQRGKVQIHSRIALQAQAKEKFSRFKRGAKFFGAMYVTEDGTIASWYRNTFTVKDAQIAAKLSCELDSGGRPCVLYASIVPNADNVGQGIHVPVSHSASKGWKEFLGYGPRGSFKAVSISRLGSFGYSWGFPTAEQAEERAWRECGTQVISRVYNKFSKEVEGLDRAGLLTCRTLIVVRAD